MTGIYRRSVTLVSGRYAMLDDGIGFSLAPWRAVIENRLGQTMAAIHGYMGHRTKTRTLDYLKLNQLRQSY